MRTYTYEFKELPEVLCVELELEWSYTYHEGVLDRLPEDCYPPEEEITVTLPDDYRERILDKYIEAANEAIKDIEDRIYDMEMDGEEVREWSKE